MTKITHESQRLPAVSNVYFTFSRGDHGSGLQNCENTVYVCLELAVGSRSGLAASTLGGSLSVSGAALTLFFASRPTYVTIMTASRLTYYGHEVNILCESLDIDRAIQALRPPIGAFYRLLIL